MSALAASPQALHPGIRVRSLQAGYPGRQVLRGVTLAFPLGKVSVLVGPGGSGKTTFVRALVGDETAQEVWRTGAVELPASRLRVLRQMPAKSAGRLCDVLAPQGTPAENAPAEARRALDAVWQADSPARGWLEPDLEQPLSEVAPWRRRLAAFTRVIAVPAPHYVFDEPDLELPPEAIGLLAGQIRRLAGAATILLVTHNLTLAERVADFAVLMVDGEVIEAAAGDRFFRHPRHPRTRDFVRLGC